MLEKYLEILWLKKWASEEEIKKAYRKLSMQYHPDKWWNEYLFKLINEAYDFFKRNWFKSNFEEKSYTENKNYNEYNTSYSENYQKNENNNYKSKKTEKNQLIEIINYLLLWLVKKEYIWRLGYIFRLFIAFIIFISWCWVLDRNDNNHFFWILLILWFIILFCLSVHKRNKDLWRTWISSFFIIVIPYLWINLFLMIFQEWNYSYLDKTFDDFFWNKYI